MMRSLFLTLFLSAMVLSASASHSRTRTTRKTIRGEKARQLHYPTSKSTTFSDSDDAEAARYGVDGFGTTPAAAENPKHGEPGHVHKGDSLSLDTAPTTTVSGTVGYGTSTTSSTSALAYTNKCDAAAAGAEFQTASSITVYYEYEVVTSTTRNILQVADIIDKAVQHFLASWLVDCDTGGRDRNRQRDLQMTLAPIVGTGVGDRDTVLMGGTSAEQCTSLMGDAAVFQKCYKVIGSTLIYLDPTMYVTPSDVQNLAVETLTVGMNYGTTDFTALDSEIYELQFLQGYGMAPEALLEENWSANQRPWDANTNTTNPFATVTNTEVSKVTETDNDGGRSGGAKFGIAFATLLCIAIAAFMAVYLYKNRKAFFDKAPRQDKLQRRHFSLDDETQGGSDTMTQASTRYDPKKARVVPDDSGSNGEMNLTFRSFSGSTSHSPNSVSTRPLSPDPETPRHPTSDFGDDPSYAMDESNIITPRCARSTISEITEHVPSNNVVETPDDRIRLRLSKETIRSGSARKKPALTTPSEYVSPNRSYQVEDTVQL